MNRLYNDVNYDAVKDVFLHGETHVDTRLYTIRYVKYQPDGGEYHSRKRYIFGKCGAKEHCEKVLHWLHKLYCNGIISDYSIRMRLVYFDTDGFSDCERDYCENDIRALNDLYADLQ